MNILNTIKALVMLIIAAMCLSAGLPRAFGGIWVTVGIFVLALAIHAANHPPAKPS